VAEASPAIRHGHLNHRGQGVKGTGGAQPSNTVLLVKRPKSHFIKEKISGQGDGEFACMSGKAVVG
jgi:hypothetical protein